MKSINIAVDTSVYSNGQAMVESTHDCSQADRDWNNAGRDSSPHCLYAVKSLGIWSSAFETRGGRSKVKPNLACLAALTLALSATGARAQTTPSIADLVAQIGAKTQSILATFGLKATLYHRGRGIGSRDSLGCPVVAMRTAAVDGVKVPRHTVLFIKETVGLKMPDGRLHDGYWYASDIGGAIHAGRIDLFTGDGARSMQPLMALNLTTLTVAKVGEFAGCPPTT
jgi:3D (Asp-Asp-Asp) domain-containing protein